MPYHLYTWYKEKVIVKKYKKGKFPRVKLRVKPAL